MRSGQESWSTSAQAKLAVWRPGASTGMSVKDGAASALRDTDAARVRVAVQERNDWCHMGGC